MKQTSNSKAATSLPSHEFWRYSLKLYSKNLVKNICLELQNHYNLNVNMILFCCWHATTGRGVLDKAVLQKLLSSIQPWHQGITEELRNLRYLLSNLTDYTWAAECRKEILGHELTAEHIEQLLMTHVYTGYIIKHRPNQQKVIDCSTSLHHYLDCCAVTLNDEIYALLKKLLAQVFQQVVLEQDIAQLTMTL